MFFRNDLTSESWSDYELLDSGRNEKLERYGNVVLSRPEPQAIWKKHWPDAWGKANAVFVRDGAKGNWELKTDIPESWELDADDVKFTVRLTSFKHTGIFPEQSPNWQWIRKCVQNVPPRSHVLNLFGYTGLASIVAAKQGAFVTHVDASKQALSWAKGNADLSGVPEDGIRYLLEDALKFAKRELRRGSTYEGIILDPPAFGRGPKGETWKIEDDMLDLLEASKELLSTTSGSFYLLNGYAAGYSADSFKQLMEDVFGDVRGEFGDLQIKESNASRVISAGIYARFIR